MCPQPLRRALQSCLPLAAVLMAGCGPKFSDSVHPEYYTFGVRRIGVLAWCVGYEPRDLARTSTPKIGPTMLMTLAPKWDEFLSPGMRREICSRLEAKGYQAVDLRGEASFGEDVRLAEFLAAVQGKRADLDAVLVVAYCASPLQVDVLDSRSYSTGGGTRTEVSYRSDVGGLILRGRLKLLHLASGRVLWELGDHYVYLHRGSSVPGAATMSKADLAAALGKQFGSAFTRRSGMIRGLPDRAESGSPALP